MTLPRTIHRREARKRARQRRTAARNYRELPPSARWLAEDALRILQRQFQMMHLVNRAYDE